MISKNIKKFSDFLKKDSWSSWAVSAILVIFCIKFVFFPFLSLVTGTPLPIVVVESCSMYHKSPFNEWWKENSAWYESRGIEKKDFEKFNMKNGLNKGDIVFIVGKNNYNNGEIIIFSSKTKYPLIHRIISVNPLSTKGDNNPGQIDDLEKNISQDAVLGKAVGRIPLLGWLKLVFFEPLKEKSKRGFCK